MPPRDPAARQRAFVAYGAALADLGIVKKGMPPWEIAAALTKAFQEDVVAHGAQSLRNNGAVALEELAALLRGGKKG